MKARVKETDEIVDVVITQRVTYTGEQVYMTDDGRLIEEPRLELNVDDDPDYWTRLEHQYAGMAMQGFISSKRGLNIETDMYDIPYYSQMLAHALVEKMKEVK